MSSWQDIFDSACEDLFKELQGEEILNVNLQAEETQFTRFNKSQVRQATEVEQAFLELELIKGKKHADFGVPIVRNSRENKAKLIAALHELKKTVVELPEDPYTKGPKNNGLSSKSFANELPSYQEYMEGIIPLIKPYDLAGVLTSGTNYRGNQNSLGQRHWFTASSFYLDYSLYTTKESAVKGTYSGTKFNKKELAQVIEESARALLCMDIKKTELKPGKYRCYFAPAALAEIMAMLSWGGVSAGAHKRGSGCFQALEDGSKKLSDKFSLTEDFSLGMSPQFNENGEVSNEKLLIIKEGKLQNFLTNSETEKEFGLKSNHANSYEGLRSPVIGTGTLKREEVLAKLGTGLYISNLHYLNWSDQKNARLTGMTRFGCLWIEDGKVVGPIKDMRFDETLYQVFGEGLEEITDFSEIMMEVSSYGRREIGGQNLPGILVNDFSFTL